MSEQAQQKAQNESSQHEAEIAAVLAILLAGPPLITAVKAISAALKMPKKVVLATLGAIKYKPGKKAIPGDGPLGLAQKQNLRFRAAYLLNALRRIAAAPDLATGIQREKALFAAHLDASKKRTQAAKASNDMTDSTNSTILGWGGILDDRTTPDCRWLIGKNFEAHSPPDGLYPGARHRNCRCFPVPEHPGKPVVTELPAHLTGNPGV
jgi:hypothetical protein